ncbi:hypothetical protein [Rufibacter sp. XAAS-G3-1]|uniref:hypothetical protein n=1 Tax=Rufibacter sp. XAAS-G3-1 TaxID=2729134 RepID=UPI0015E7D348|nr:hypothetical protein [Rufibacter sp. XAAS-G3-1]
MKITKVKLRTKAMKDNRESVRLDYPPIPHLAPSWMFSCTPAAMMMKMMMNGRR